MLYYEIEVKVTSYPAVDGDADENSQTRTTYWRGRRGVLSTFLSDAAAGQVLDATVRSWDADSSTVYFLAEAKEDTAYLGALCSDRIRSETTEEYLRTIGIQHDGFSAKEVTMGRMDALAEHASQYDYIPNADVPFAVTGKLERGRRDDLDETIVRRRDSAEELKEAALTMLSASLAEEVDRIFAVPNDGDVPGHPVHYTIESDSEEFAIEARDILVSALVQAGRLKSSRVLTCRDQNETRFHDVDLHKSYELSSPGTIMVCVADENEGPYMLRRSEGCGPEQAARELLANHDDVLTMLWLPKSSNKLRGEVEAGIGDASLVRITEDTASKELALSYLRAKAEKARLEPDESLFCELEEDGIYTVSDLARIFSRWRKARLRTTIYPQYSAMQSSAEAAAKSSAKGTAIGQLHELVGLEDIKGQLSEILDYFKVQKVLADRGMREHRPTLHMVFSGNPGTAKTTVARLVGRILAENGVLPDGDLYEVGRSDLVGKYVGHTAPQVKQMFRSAEGGVLFIDEAYSLVDDKAGMYGDEAINTIVQEMENKRDDVMVIFAGYSDRMEEFVSRNPGLRSRLAAQISFPDYTPEELLKISAIEAKGMDLELAPETEDKLLEIYRKVADIPDFGNGRYVRNLLEKARMRQSQRLLKYDLHTITDTVARTILTEDIVEVPAQTRDVARTMGFSA